MASADAIRAGDLSSRRALALCYARSGSASVLLPALLALSAARLWIGRWGWIDAAVIGVLVLLTGFVEWVVHRNLLHASVEAWTSRRLGIGSGHRLHHADPGDVRWLLLPPVDAAVFLVMLSLFTASWVGAGAVGFSRPVGPAVTTGLLATSAALLHYEIVHLLAHARVRARSRFYSRLTANHLRHHHRDERRWLGVTSNLADRVLGTYR